MTGFRRQRVLDMDVVSGSVTSLDGNTGTEGYELVRVLVRVHEEPVGIVVVSPTGDSNLLDAVRGIALQRFRQRIDAHLQADGHRTIGTADELRDVVDSCPQVVEEPPAGPLVTVAIPSLRNVQSTVTCIQRVTAGSYDNLEVLVVDNDQNGQPLRAAIDRAFGHEPRVRYVHEPRTGVSFARNRGLSEAGGDIVAFIDDDVLVDRRWLERLVTAFTNNPAPAPVACVTGSILAAEMESRAQSWLEEFGGFNKGFDRQVYDLVNNRRPEALYPFDAGRFGSGANMAFRTEILRSFGGFATDLGPGTPTFGGEDIDALRRVISSGYTLVYEPRSIVWHFHRRSDIAVRRQMYRYGVGLSALVTKWLIEKETRLPVLSRIPPGVVHVLKPSSTKNESKSPSYPALLTGLELVGLAMGPWAYLRSRYLRKGVAS